MAGGWSHPAGRLAARLRGVLGTGPCAWARAGRRAPPKLRRRSVRLRLTLMYGGLFLISGAGLLAITYGLVAHALPGNLKVLSTSGTAGGSRTGRVAGTGGCPGAVAGILPAPAQISVCTAYLEHAVARQRAEELDQLLTESGFALAGMTVVSLGLGWLVAGRVLHPLRTITAAARRVSASSLHERLALEGPADELKELGDTFDGLLGRLERAFDAQRQFVANASHELRSPLTRQRTLVEVALADPEPTVVSLQAVCARVLAAGQQQERLIEALLTLARSQRGLDRRAWLDLALVAGEVTQERRPEAESGQLRLSTSLGRAPALGDEPLMERLVANLLDNAVRHNIQGGWVTVTTGTRRGTAVLAVANSGARIPAAEVSRLYQPFQRLGTDRSGHPESPGLGLSIVAAIAAAHGGELYARALAAGGLEVEAHFPLAQGGGEPGTTGHAVDRRDAHPARIGR